MKHYKSEDLLDRFASPLVVRPKEASDGFHTIGDVMPLTASAHVVACATTDLCQFLEYQASAQTQSPPIENFLLRF